MVGNTHYFGNYLCQVIPGRELRELHSLPVTLCSFRFSQERSQGDHGVNSRTGAIYIRDRRLRIADELGTTVQRGTNQQL